MLSICAVGVLGLLTPFDFEASRWIWEHANPEFGEWTRRTFFEGDAAGLSDPGKTLVRMVRNAGFRVVPVPGVSAATALLSVSGHVGKQTLFEGFLSPKPGRRRKRISELLQYEMPFILFESPHRILKLLSDLADLSDRRNIVIGREMTKIHEEIVVGSAAEVLALFEERESQRGEFTLLVEVEKKN